MQRLGPLSHFAWSVVVGVVGALSAVVFRGLIALFHNLFFLGQWSVVYDANAHTPASPWGPFMILVPAWEPLASRSSSAIMGFGT